MEKALLRDGVDGMVLICEKALPAKTQRCFSALEISEPATSVPHLTVLETPQKQLISLPTSAKGNGFPRLTWNPLATQ